MVKPNKNVQNKLRFAVLATDIALFTLRDNNLFARIIRVHRPPFFHNRLGLPGGLIAPKETAEAAVARHLATKAGISKEHVYMEQLYTFSGVNRDPRGRVVAVAYLALAPWEHLSLSERDDTADARWLPINHLPPLAYDHDEIVTLALERLRAKVSYTTLIVKLLPREFTLTELERAYESILQRKIDRRNFRKKIKKLRLVESLKRERRGEKHRPAMLYSFRSQKVVPIEIL